MNPKLQKVLAYLSTIIASGTAASLNPFPQGSAQSTAFLTAIGFIGTFLTLVIHPNGVNGPAADKKGGGDVKLGPGAAVLFLVLFSASGCALLKAGNTATVTIDGQTITGTVEADGTVCTTYQPPITYAGEACTEICSLKAAPYISLTCNSALNGVRHTITLTKVDVTASNDSTKFGTATWRH